MSKHSDPVTKTTKQSTRGKKSKKKSHKKLVIILSIIGGLLLAAGVGLAVWFYAFYNNDKRVLNDAFHNFMSSDAGSGAMNIKMNVAETETSSSMRAEFDYVFRGNSDVAVVDMQLKAGPDEMYLDLSANMAATSSGDIYLRVNKLGKTLESMGVEADQLGIDVDAISDKWFKFSMADLEELSGAPINDASYKKYYECMNDVVLDLQNNRDMQEDLLRTIQDSGFLSAQRVGGDKNGIKFNLEVNLDETGTLIRKIIGAKFVDGFIKCYEYYTGTSIFDSESDSTSDTESSFSSDLAEIKKFVSEHLDAEFHFWVSEWNHKPTRAEFKLKITDAPNVPDIKISATMSMDYKKVEVSVPNDAASGKSLIKDIQRAISPYADQQAQTFFVDDYFDDDYVRTGNERFELVCKGKTAADCELRRVD
ncbi:hypothetical protein FWD20_00050 [Candidatus Saccharibacteria bacterium]|nr:hypothetical protein [Candidatus Saccharibacteria bacterium]